MAKEGLLAGKKFKQQYGYDERGYAASRDPVYQIHQLTNLECSFLKFVQYNP
jgi:hypothetical protein